MHDTDADTEALENSSVLDLSGVGPKLWRVVRPFLCCCVTFPPARLHVPLTRACTHAYIYIYVCVEMWLAATVECKGTIHLLVRDGPGKVAAANADIRADHHKVPALLATFLLNSSLCLGDLRDPLHVSRSTICSI